jgi:hypothetical protein
MGLLLNVIYQYVFLYISLPIFGIVLFGRPKFLITWIHNALNLRDPFSKIRIFRFIFIFNLIYFLYCLFMIRRLHKNINELQFREVETIKGMGMLSYMDDKMREANLFERNAYMFLTFDILILVFQKLCFTYFKLWKSENDYNKLKAVREAEVKNPENLQSYISKHLYGETPGNVPEIPTFEASRNDKYASIHDEVPLGDIDLKDSVKRAY